MSKEERITKAHEVIAKITQNLNDLVELLITEKTVEEHPVSDNKKKRRDPNAPKPPTSNFFLFTNSIRDEVEKEFPDSTFAEKSKIYGARWQKLSEEDRKPFSEKAKEEREKYNKKMAVYEAEQGEEHTEKKVKKEAPAKAAPAKASAKATAEKAAKATTEKAASSTKATKAAKAAVVKPAKTATKATPAKAVPAKPTKKVVDSTSSSDSDSDDSSSSSDSDSE